MFDWLKSMSSATAPVTMSGRRAAVIALRAAIAALLVSMALCASTALGQSEPDTASRARADRWWAHVSALAHDSMRGRETGTQDYVKAAGYVARQFQLAGLEPAGTDSYFQPARLAAARLVAERSGAALLENGAPSPLRLNTDVTFTATPSMSRRVEAPLVFVGYGVHLPGTHDDLASADLRGKVAVYLNRMPPGLPATMLAHARASRWADLRRAGAAGAIALRDSAPRPQAPGTAAAARPRPVYGLADDTTGGIQMMLNPQAAERLLAGSGHTFAEIAALSDAGKPLPTFALTRWIRAWVELERREVQAPNVVGLMRGNDPRLAGEYLVVTAHLDHIGVRRSPTNTDSIYNGAMDNASGVATLIETAHAFRDTHAWPSRSVIFLAVTGEEEGLLGSAYFATHPTVPATQIVADLNTDMFLPLFPLRGVFAYGAEESDLGDDLGQVLSARGLALFPDPEPEQVRFIRSDQYSFIRRGIPALALKVGYAQDSPEMGIAVTWRTERYHQPSDDLAQPVNLRSAADFNAMYFDLVRAVASRPTRPAWRATSIFGHVAN